MDQNCDLIFPLPEQQDASRSEIKAALDIYKSTLSDLPYGNQEKAAKEIFEVLYKSNKVKLKNEDRSDLLKEIEDKAPQVVSGLRDKIKDVTVPVGRREEKVAKILVGIHYQLALAYRCLLSEHQSPGLLRKSNNMADADSIRLTIFHLGEVLRTKYSVFANPSGTIWRYVYTLFICASNSNMHEEKLPSSNWCGFDTVEGVFKSILLMSLSSPLTMRGSEFSALYDLAPELAQYITLGKINCGESYSDLMTFNLSGTESPKKQFATGCDSCSNASNCFTVNTSNLLQHLEEQQGQIKAGERLNSLQQLLSKDNQYEKLLRNLTGSEKVDHEERIAGGGIIELVAGFNDIYTFMGKVTPEQTVSADEKKAMDDWTTIGDEAVAVEETIDWTATGIVRAGLRKTTCNVINHSSGGYCLYIDVLERFHLRVGELVLVQGSAKSKWQLAVIIWVSGHKKRMDFGIKLLEGTVSRGTLSSIDDQGTQKSIECLFLKIENGDDDTSIRIITAAPDLTKGDRLFVTYLGGEYKVVVVDVNSTTEGYVEYLCDWSGFEESEVVIQDKEPEKAVSAETDFESIWDEL
jgi:hypothetical protein